jgi:hypothetical protein
LHNPRLLTPAQLFAKAVTINDLNYVMLKRRDDAGNMPPLSLKRVFCIFAMLDKFLGGDGLRSGKSELMNVTFLLTMATATATILRILKVIRLWNYKPHRKIAKNSRNYLIRGNGK